MLVATVPIPRTADAAVVTFSTTVLVASSLSISAGPFWARALIAVAKKWPMDLNGFREKVMSVLLDVSVDGRNEVPKLEGPVEVGLGELLSHVEAECDPVLNLLDLGGVDDGVHAALDIDHSFLRSEEHTSELQSLRHLVCRL